MAGNETVEVRFSSNRSPLFVRLTETVCCAVLATLGVLTTAGNAPANRPTAIATATTPLSFPSISVSRLWRSHFCRVKWFHCTLVNFSNEKGWLPYTTV